MLYDASSFINVVSVRSIFTRLRRRRREHRTPLHKKWRVCARYSHSIMSITNDCVKSNYNFSKKYTKPNYALWIFVLKRHNNMYKRDAQLVYTKRKNKDKCRMFSNSFKLSAAMRIFD